MHVKPLARVSAGIFVAMLAPTPASAITVEFIDGAGVAGNAAVLAALDRAAAQWATRLHDPILVTLDVSFADLSAPNVIGEAASVQLTTTNDGYNFVRDALLADAADEADDAIVAALPALSGLSANLPAGITMSNELAGTKANFKALGFDGNVLDNLFGVRDATIRFNSRFAFDFLASDGIGPGLTDFETVAAHEIGHALGFISIVDEVDFLVNAGAGGVVTPRLLDLFRFAPAAAPATPAEFTDAAREWRPNVAAVFGDGESNFALSTGAFTGDGRQASHFKDDALTALHLGILDPTLASGVAFAVTNADLRVLDLIGYEFAVVPVPPMAGAAALALLALAAQRRHRA